MANPNAKKNESDTKKSESAGDTKSDSAKNETSNPRSGPEGGMTNAKGEGQGAVEGGFVDGEKGLALTKKEMERRARVEREVAKAKNVTAAQEAARAGDTGWRVASGKALTTCRGVVDGDNPKENAVSPLDFVKFEKDRDQGLRRLEELRSKGYVVRTQAAADSVQ